MAALTATATCIAYRAVAERTGELVPTRLLAERVRLLAALTQELATAVLAARWNDRDLATLESGVGPDGRALPAKGWMALRRLGWAAAAPEGVHVSDRCGGHPRRPPRGRCDPRCTGARSCTRSSRAGPPILGGEPTPSGQRCTSGSRKG